MMNYQELLTKTETYVNMFYTDYTGANLFYHNQSHAKEVLEYTKKIAKQYFLDDRTFFIVCAAASFFDLVHLIKNGKFHKMESAKLARDFFTTLDVNETDTTLLQMKNVFWQLKCPKTPNR